MPVMDGLEATRQIRAVEKEHALKKAYIVACTGLSAPIDRKKAAQVGCDVRHAVFTKVLLADVLELSDEADLPDNFATTVQ